MRKLYTDLADYQLSNGDFDDATATLRSVLAELPPNHDMVDVKWKALYTIGVAYHRKRDFEESIGHAQAALGIAEDIFPPQDDRIVDTLQLIVDIFVAHGVSHMDTLSSLI